MQNQKKLIVACIGLLEIFLIFTQTVFAAKPIDLSHQHGPVLQSFLIGKVTVKEISRQIDNFKMTHVRIQEMYDGYPIWGADAVVHIPDADVARQTFNGIFYQGISADLINTPAFIFSSDQAMKAYRTGLDAYKFKTGKNLNVVDKQNDMIVFIDQNNKAHFAFKISFIVDPVKADEMPAHPVFIIDAVSLYIYKQWDDIQTIEKEVFAGGLGSNTKLGKIYYDGIMVPFHQNKLTMTRQSLSGICRLKNSHVTVKRFKLSSIMFFRCNSLDRNHNNLYWDGAFDSANGGFSPANDALYGGQIVLDLYKNWYGVPVLVNKNGSSMMLNMIVHKPFANAYWDGNKMIFGDGNNVMFPLTTLDIAAHEISHGFTEQHSNLVYDGQSGAINESFSDMAGQAALFYATSVNNWQIGAGIFKNKNTPIRYIDDPTKDGFSIDNANNYTEDLDVHYGSGVFNKAFYLLATMPNWDTKKAFDVMVRANQYYWTRTTSFHQGACGAIAAGKALNYPVADISDAFSKVGITTTNC